MIGRLLIAVVGSYAIASNLRYGAERWPHAIGALLLTVGYMVWSLFRSQRREDTSE